jgi:cytidine deaminase
MKTIKFSKLSEKDKKLILYAEKSLKNAYDPYSQFYVGAAVLTKDGKIFLGANINTCAYASLCAERSAIANAVTNGEYFFEKIAIIGICLALA